MNGFSLLLAAVPVDVEYRGRICTASERSHADIDTEAFVFVFARHVEAPSVPAILAGTVPVAYHTQKTSPATTLEGVRGLSL